MATDAIQPRDPGSNLDPTTSTAKLGLILGLVLGGGTIVLAPLVATPDGLSVAAIRTLGVTLLVGIWWVTEALPLGATGLVPAALFPLLGIAPAAKLAPAYMSPFIMLLLGGFLLSMALERSRAHERLALHALLIVGTSARNLVLGFLIATAGVSMWISNTSATLIMMPIALALVQRTRSDDPGARGFAPALLLSTAYGASVGGMGTPIGTPPNLIAIGALEKAFPDGPKLTFVSWMVSGVPAVLVIVPIAWLLLTRFAIKVPKSLELGAGDLVRSELERLGPWRSFERRALALFGVAAVMWMSREDVSFGDFSIAGWATRLGLDGLPDDGTVAMLLVVLAFMIPSGERTGDRMLRWEDAARAPWDLVLLFGGGMAISTGFVSTGLSTWLGEGMARLGAGSAFGFMAVASLGATFLTEFMSNTALANIAMPMIAAAAGSFPGTDPRLFIVSVALGTSCAFMMPAATGPNAIVFGTGKIRIREMARAGVLLNFSAWAVIVAASWLAYG
ncbi:MAG: SLC13/DASS family transporter [Deltaproteobacteria bacterium]|nr:SLC13/DASS family transporter [Deltaproteobacteria bacterium]